jgi:hypothetical protein
MARTLGEQDEGSPFGYVKYPDQWRCPVSLSTGYTQSRSYLAPLIQRKLLQLSRKARPEVPQQAIRRRFCELDRVHKSVGYVSRHVDKFHCIPKESPS